MSQFTKRTERHDVQFYLIHETPSAFLVSEEPGRNPKEKHWLPKSKCHEGARGDGPNPWIALSVPGWLLVEKGLEYLA